MYEPREINLKSVYPIKGANRLETAKGTNVYLLPITEDGNRTYETIPLSGL